MNPLERLTNDAAADASVRGLIEEARLETAAPAAKAKTLAALGLGTAPAATAATLASVGGWKALAVGALVLGGAAAGSMWPAGQNQANRAPQIPNVVPSSVAAGSAEAPALGVVVPTSPLPSTAPPEEHAGTSPAFVAPPKEAREANVPPAARAESARRIAPARREPEMAPREGALFPPGVPAQASARAELAASRGEDAAPSSITEEAHTLERARQEIGARRGRQALAILDHYARSFPKGELGPEAMALRVEALEAAGDREATRALGTQFVLQYPGHPAVARVRRAVSATNP